VSTRDVANANSTGCLAAHLLDTTGAQTVAIEVEQGDTLGRPASVLASARRGLETTMERPVALRG
jgi:predicted PhzF superfamily epimerase YddE/YHI9